MIDRVGRRIPTTMGLVILIVGIIPIALAGSRRFGKGFRIGLVVGWGGTWAGLAGLADISR